MKWYERRKTEGRSSYILVEFIGNMERKDFSNLSQEKRKLFLLDMAEKCNYKLNNNSFSKYIQIDLNTYSRVKIELLFWMEENNIKYIEFGINELKQVFDFRKE